MPTLRSSALNLAYSAADYRSAVWPNVAHTKLVDRQLNILTHIITGTDKSTPNDGLPVQPYSTPISP